MNRMKSCKLLFDKYLNILKRELNADSVRFRRKVLGEIRNPQSFDEIKNQHAVFVLSTGRCGTKWLTNLLNNSKKIIVKHDPDPKIYFCSRYIYANNFDVETIISSFIHCRFHLLYNSFCLNLPYIETNNRITFYAEAISKLMPNSRFVHLIRHPHEVIRSGMRREWYGIVNSEFGGHIRPRDDEPIAQQWGGLSREEKIAWLWCRTNQTIEKLKNNIAQDRIFFIRSSDMFTDLSCVSKLLHFMYAEDLIKSTNVIKEQQKKVVNKQHSGEYPTYENWDYDVKKKIGRVLEKYNTYGFKL